MARVRRIVAPGYPHHIIHRGNRPQRTSFSKEDYRACLLLMTEWCDRFKVSVWAYCLMPNHVHLVGVLHDEEGLRRPKDVNLMPPWGSRF